MNSKTHEYKEDIQPVFFQEISRADSYLYDKYRLRPYNPDDLFQKKGNYDLFDTMREDDQISACLMLKKLMILGQWEIGCEDEKVKAQLEWNLKEGLDELFEKKLLNILTSKDYGFSLTEKIFEYVDTPNWGKKIIISKLKTRAPHSFEFDQDDSGNITQIRQSQSKGDDIELKPEKFIHYINNKEFDNPYGRADFASIGVYRAWFTKENVIKYWAMFLEKFGSPTAVGTYEKTMTNQKDVILKILKRIQQNTAIVMPEGVKVELLEAMKSGTQQSGYEAAINRFDKMITIAMLQPDKIGMSGETVKGGSYSLGKEHFGMFYELINTDKKQLARQVNREIISPLVLWNYGTGVKAEFKFIQIDQAKKNEQYKLWLDAIKTGKIMTNLEQWNHFLQGLDFPEIDEKEFEEDKIRREEIGKQIQGIDKKDSEEEEEEEPGKKPEEEPEEKKQTKDYTIKYDRRIDYKKIERETEKIESKYKEEIADIFKLMINGLADEIRRKKIIERKRLDIINKLELRHKDKLTRLIKSMMKEGMELGSETARSEIPNKYYIVNPVPGLSDEDVAVWLEESALYVSSVESAFILKAAKPILAESIRNGLGTKEAMKMLDTALKGYDIDIEDIGGANRIENIVRTNTSKAFNEMRNQEFAKVSNHIKGYWVSIILDKRTSEVCQELDSNVQGIYKPNEAPDFPAHYQCRTIKTAVFEDEPVDNWATMPAVEKEAGGFLRLKK